MNKHEIPSASCNKNFSLSNAATRHIQSHFPSLRSKQSKKTTKEIKKKKKKTKQSEEIYLVRRW
jgi:hypothetical protein